VALLQDTRPRPNAALAPAVRRPPVVTFVGMLGLGVGAYLVVAGLLVILDGDDGSGVSAGAFDVALGVLAILIGVGVLRMRRWAWETFMVWAVIGLTHQLVRHFFYDKPNYLGMALNAVVVLALTPLDVQIAFGVRPPRNVRLDRPSRNPLDSA
jgi:hypothetical protein